MIHLVIGGARSGKSHYAEKIVKDTALGLSLPMTYIATATAEDEEMQVRIEHHQQQRDESWQLIEEMFFLSSVIESLEPDPSVKVRKVILVECMTLWLSNWLCREQRFDDQSQWLKQRQQFIKALSTSQNEIVIVSNEVGCGVVPLGELSRHFVDQAGWLNQQLAKIADRVTLVVAGLPLELKTDDFT